MMKLSLSLSAFALAVSFALPNAAQAEECTFEKDPFDFSPEEVTELYDCVKDRLAESYAKEGHEIGSVYRDWKVTATGPAIPGTHSNRFLLTFANDVAYDEYVKYADSEDFSMPVGSVLAKESYKLNKEGKPRLGPLFLMTKVAAGEADEFDNWVYGGVQPNGKVMKVSQSFCHDCHAAFETQDSLGYPAWDVRFGN